MLLVINYCINPSKFHFFFKAGLHLLKVMIVMSIKNNVKGTDLKLHFSRKGQQILSVAQHHDSIV